MKKKLTFFFLFLLPGFSYGAKITCSTSLFDFGTHIQISFQSKDELILSQISLFLDEVPAEILAETRGVTVNSEQYSGFIFYDLGKWANKSLGLVFPIGILQEKKFNGTFTESNGQSGKDHKLFCHRDS